MKLPVYNIEGKEVKKIDLDESIFGLDWNGDLVYQTTVASLGNARTNIAHTKNRGEVSGGGKKPWRQKGTGRARHGSSRSPIWKGGGVTFGPRNDQNFKRKINKKMKIKAFATILSQKVRDNELILIDSFKIETPKTKEGKIFIDLLSKNENLANLATKKRNNALIGISKRDDSVEKTFSNFSNLGIEEVRNIDSLSVLKYKYLMIFDAEESLKILAERLIKNNK